MSHVTLADLLTFDSGAFYQAADAWRDLARDLDDATESYCRDGNEIPHAWQEGAAAEAAARAFTRLRSRISNAEDPARRTGQALRMLANAIVDLRETASQIVQEARGKGYTVNLDDVSVGGPAVKDAATAQNASGIAHQLQMIVDKARYWDDSATSLINDSCPPDGPLGFGDHASSPVRREDLAAQHGRSPAEVREWWEYLTPEQQEQAIRDFPELVGWLDGVPIEDRDVANRISLDRQQAAVANRKATLDDREKYIRDMVARGRGSELYPGVDNKVAAAEAELAEITSERTTIDEKLRALNTIKNRLNDPGKPQAYLVGISTDGNGRAIVSIGNPDTAQNVATFVPGTGSRLKNGMGDIGRCDAMALDAQVAAPGERTAVLLWLGYDAPQSIPEATRATYADGAAADLRRFEEGLRATHDGPAAHQTVLGHSYGTTVVGHAATGGSLNADDLVFVASPGVGVDHASDLRLTNHGSAAGHTYATTAEHDIIAKAGSFKQILTELSPIPLDNRVDGNPTDPRWLIHGQSPVDGHFGATVFNSDPGPATDPFGTHSNYWERDNKARDGMALIIVGDGEQLGQHRPDPATRQQPSPSPGQAPVAPR